MSEIEYGEKVQLQFLVKGLGTLHGLPGDTYTVRLGVQDGKVCSLEIKVKATIFIDSDGDNSRACVNELHRRTHKEGGSPVSYGRLEYGLVDGELELVKINETVKWKRPRSRTKIRERLGPNTGPTNTGPD